jgi:hypothetical protein
MMRSYRLEAAVRVKGTMQGGRSDPGFEKGSGSQMKGPHPLPIALHTILSGWGYLPLDRSIGLMSSSGIYTDLFKSYGLLFKHDVSNVLYMRHVGHVI